MSDTNKMTLIASKGTFDWAYPPLILASTGVAMGKEVSVFLHLLWFKFTSKRSI